MNFISNILKPDNSASIETFTGYRTKYTALYANAAASKKEIYDFIDEIYNKNKFHYYNLAKNSTWYNNMCIMESSILRIGYARKVLGIILADDKQYLLDIIERGWPFIYKKVKQAKSVSVTSVMSEYLQTKKLTTLTSDIISSASLITFLCMDLMERPAAKVQNTDEFYEGRETLLMYYGEKHHFTYDVMSDYQKSTSRNHKKKVYDLYNKGKSIKLRELPGLPCKETLNSILLILDSEELSVSSLVEPVEITEQDMEKMIAAYLLSNSSSAPEDILNFLSYAIFILALIKLYKETRDYFFTHNTETMSLEIDSLELENKRLLKELELQKAQYDKLQQSYAEVQKLLSDEQKGLSSTYENRIKRLEKQVNDLEEEAETYKKEVIPLREYVFSSNNNSSQEPETVEEVKIGTKGVIFGGNEKWVNKLKDKLPNFKFINNENFDMTVLDYTEAVFFNTSYISHSLYYKVIDYTRKHQTKIFYVNNNNVDMVISQIYKYLMPKN